MKDKLKWVFIGFNMFMVLGLIGAPIILGVYFGWWAVLSYFLGVLALMIFRTLIHNINEFMGIILKDISSDE